MCRETQMAVAAAQLALGDAKLAAGMIDPERSGVVLGSDYMLTMPEDYTAGIRKCASSSGGFEFARWGREGLREMAPLWMLKYLPNMPASHIAIFNDFRGPNNSLTMREASSNLAIAEAFRTIERGHAECMIAGATGTRILPMQSLHALQTEQMADTSLPPAEACRPFDKHRTGMVAGEGAGMLILEELAFAAARGANVYGEIIGAGSSNVADHQLHGRCTVALSRAIRSTLTDAGHAPADVGHINAHGLATVERDAEEARAIAEVFNEHANELPITALKSYFGNLGAGSGVVELVASLLAWRHDQLPTVLNYRSPDPACPIRAVTAPGTPPGETCLKLSVTPQGQAAALFVSKYQA
jgi:3-oxoacyl-[acyl-carrier-protein] synthase II